MNRNPAPTSLVRAFSTSPGVPTPFSTRTRRLSPFASCCSEPGKRARIMASAWAASSPYDVTAPPVSISVTGSTSDTSDPSAAAEPSTASRSASAEESSDERDPSPSAASAATSAAWSFGSAAATAVRTSSKRASRACSGSPSAR